MALENVESSSGYLVSTDTDGWAKSELVVQDASDGDFSSIKNISADFEFVNISSSSSSADTLVTDELITDGDKLVIVKDDDSINDFTVGSVTDIIWETVGSTVTKSDNNHTVNSSTDSDHTNSQCYSQLITTDINIDFVYNGTSNLFGISTINTKQDSYFAAVSSGYAYHLNDGIKYHDATTASYGVATTAGDIITLHYTRSTGILGFSVNGTYQGDCYTLTANTDVYIATSLYKSDCYFTVDTPYTVDTTSTTNGETPSRVFRIDEQVFFNDVEAGYDSDNYTYGSPALTSTRTLQDTDITPSRTLQTKVQLSATGNKCTKVSADVWKDD